MTDVSIRHVIVTGRVQGVCYRQWTSHKALQLGLTGWVYNRPDGTVEAYFKGPERAVNDMLEACKSGPLLARVDNINAVKDPSVDPESFLSRQEKFVILEQQ